MYLYAKPGPINASLSGQRFLLNSPFYQIYGIGLYLSYNFVLISVFRLFRTVVIY